MNNFKIGLKLILFLIDLSMSMHMCVDVFHGHVPLYLLRQRLSLSSTVTQ